ncbi:MAG: hypothetical protein NT130_05095 [Candidatus Micrarchaeota archaeon]|nr:hypothetical protein [Candidatus Micrarchaeota archaeon]
MFILGCFGASNTPQGNTPPQDAKSKQYEQLNKDLQTYNTILQGDSDKLGTLNMEGNAIISRYNNATTKQDRYTAFSDYLTWAQKYANHVELMDKHLADYEDYLSDNKALLDEGKVNTIQLESSIGDSRIALKQSAQQVKTNIESMKATIEMEQKIEQQKQDLIMNILRILIGLS